MKELFTHENLGSAPFVTWNGLVACGVSAKTIENWTRIKCPHPEDARIKIFKVADLRPRYQELIQAHLCDGMDPVKWIMREKQNEAIEKAKLMAVSLQESVVAKPEDVAFFMNTAFFTEAESKQLARAWSWLCLLNRIKGKKDALKYGYKTKGDLLEDACDIIGGEDLKGLRPRGTAKLNKRVLQRKLKDASEQGRECLISNHHGKVKFAKITDQISDWLVAQYAQPVKGRDMRWLHYQYELKAAKEGWPTLSKSAIYTHLNKPEIQKLWFVGRHGSHAARAAFGHTLKLKTASMRDALWVSDGTKLDWYYMTEDGRKAHLQFYLVVDAYSEVILGWDIDRTENFVTQYKAAKMALQTAGHKPNQWIYDGQGGHVKKESQDFLDRVVLDLHHKVRPYRAHAKPIEQMINRFQQECVMKYWFCDGQGVRTKKANSRPNMEFILANQDRLLTADQLIGLFEKEVTAWNNSKHPHMDVTRMAAYEASVNPHSEELHYLDMVDLFWHTSKNMVQYRKDGLKMISRKQVYWFEVYDEHGAIDMDFRKKYVGTIPVKFTVKYDPECLDEVWLYLPGNDGSLKYVAKAEKKREHARALIDLKPGDRKELEKDLRQGDREQESWKDELEAIRMRAGVRPEDVFKEVEQAIIEGVFTDKDAMKHAEAVFIDGSVEGGEDVGVDPWNQVT